jgi:hypothetical protein
MTHAAPATALPSPEEPRAGRTIARPPEVVYPAGGSGLVHATIRHPKHTAALEQCLEHLTSPADSYFLFLVGAAGSGKTNLLRLLYAALLDEYAADMAADPDVIPVLDLITPPPTDGTYRWRAFGATLFEAARTASRGRPSAGPVGLASRGSSARTFGKTTDDVLGEAVRACADRGVRVILLDEAGHLASVAQTAAHRRMLDVLKGLALSTGIRFVLAGPYELLDLRDASTQLGRRSRLVHLAPYDLAREREQRAWTALVRAMMELTSAPWTDDLATVAFDGALGCVGILRDWMVDAEHASRRRSRQSFRACLDDLRRSPGQLAAIGAELEAGLYRLAVDAGTAPRPQPIPSVKGARKPRVTANGQHLRPGEMDPRRRLVTGDAA